MAEPNYLVWITGANGLIGNYLTQTSARFAPSWKLRRLTRSDFDLLDFAAVERAFKEERPQIIIHCAAITVVAEAQKDPGLAWRVNFEITKFLAGLASRSRFVFLSTDLVFDGKKGNYSETDRVNPLTRYGETKSAAEEVVLQNPGHLVVRTSINGGVSLTGNRAFNEQLRASLQGLGQGMTLFNDEFRCPIPAVETARAVWELAHRNCAGLYHVAGAEKLSRWQIGQLLVRRWPEVQALIRSGSAREFAGPPRALDTSLDIDKSQRILSKPLPGLTAWLNENPHEPF